MAGELNDVALNLSVPGFPHLWNGNNRENLIGLLWGLMNE